MVGFTRVFALMDRDNSAFRLAAVAAAAPEGASLPDA